MTEAVTHKRRKPKWAVEIGLSWLFGGISLGFMMFCFLSLLLLLFISTSLNAYLAWGISNLELPTGQQPAPVPTIVAAAAKPTATRLPAPTTTPAPTVPLPPVPPPPIIPTPTQHPITDYTIEGLRRRTYPGGIIQIRSVLTTTNDFTRYYIDYPSDNLTITGIMQIPQGGGPFPVIILNHGYIPREQYWPGADTSSAAGYLNRHGYLTIAPDFRSWGESDSGNSFFSTGQLIDVLNLISSLSSVPQADLEKVGLWGHSMGGGIVMKAITIDPRIKAAVLYAPVSANDAEVLERWGPGCEPTQGYQLADKCGGAEVLANDIDRKLFLAYADAVYDPEFLYRVSAINYVDFITAPVQIHIGTADTRTPPEWSATINEQLQAAGKEVEYLAYPGQGHLLRGKSYHLFMQRVADFFDRYLVH